MGEARGNGNDGMKERTELDIAAVAKHEWGGGGKEEGKKLIKIS